jgi:mannose-1-phosphate guanylyltransferase/mannose-6-phosphate isomerase
MNVESINQRRISMRSGAKLGLQMHHHRAEHWIVVTGPALVTRGEEDKLRFEHAYGRLV